MKKIGTDSMLQLETSHAIAYLEQMKERSRNFQALLEKFSSDGFQFIFSRAKVFLYAPEIVNYDDIIAPNLIGILPSFRPVRRDDPFHTAVGIAVHSSTGVVATEVRVDHDPFLVSKWTLHEVVEGEVASYTISTDELSSSNPEDVAERFGKVKVDLGGRRSLFAPPDPRQIERMILVGFEEIINDSYARPLYPDGGIASLMSQAPEMVKFSEIQRLRYANSPRWFVATSSTCCNGCTTSSVAYASE